VSGKVGCRNGGFALQNGRRRLLGARVCVFCVGRGSGACEERLLGIALR
jgi:hypothetical protein